MRTLRYAHCVGYSGRTAYHRIGDPQFVLSALRSKAYRSRSGVATAVFRINLDTAGQCAVGLGCFVSVAKITASRKRTLVGWVERNDTHPTFADAMLAAYVLNLTTCLNLLQYPNNLIFAEPALTHLGLVVCRKTTSHACTALWEGYTQSAPAKFINTRCARQTRAISSARRSSGPATATTAGCTAGRIRRASASCPAYRSRRASR